MKNTSEQEKIKIGLIGLGYAGATRYLPVMSRMKEFDVVGVIDSDANAAACTAKKFGIANHSSSDNIKAIKWIDDLNAVVIATPPFFHYKYIKEFLEKGKHVLVDKPFVMTLSEAQEVVELAKQKNLKLAIIHNFQFSSAFNQLLTDRDNGKLGNIKAVSCSLLNNPKRDVPDWHHDLPWGQFYDESPHSFYMINRLFPNNLSYVSSCYYPNSNQSLKTPSSIFVNYTAKDESGFLIPVTADFNFEASLSEWHFKVVGENGVAIVDYFRNTYMFLANDRSHKLMNVLNTSLSFTWQHWSNQIIPAFKFIFCSWLPGHDVVIRNFADALLRGKELKFMDSSSAMRILSMQYEVMNTANQQSK